jgi:hypothetical protein
MKRLLSTNPSSRPRNTTLKEVLPKGGIFYNDFHKNIEENVLCNLILTLSSKKELWKCTVLPEIEVMSMLLLLSTLNKVTFSK